MCFGIRFYKSCGCPGLSLPACPLVGMTPPPVRRYKGFPLQAAAVGTQRLCLLITTLQAGQTWTGLLFPANRENPDSLFCPACSFPDQHENTMPGGMVYKCALAFFSPRQVARELLIDPGCQKCFCVTFAKSNKIYSRFRRPSVPIRSGQIAK